MSGSARRRPIEPRSTRDRSVRGCSRTTWPTGRRRSTGRARSSASPDRPDCRTTARRNRATGYAIVRPAAATARRSAAGDRPRPKPAPPTVWEQMGGPMGMLDSGLPVVVFVVANVIGGLGWGIGAAVAAAFVIAVLRIARQAADHPGGRRPVRGRDRRLHRLQDRLGQGLLPARHLELPAVRRRAAAVHPGPLAADRGDLGGHQRQGHGLAVGQESWSAATTGPLSSGCWCSRRATWCRTTCTTPTRSAGWPRSGC